MGSCNDVHCSFTHIRYTRCRTHIASRTLRCRYKFAYIHHHLTSARGFARAGFSLQTSHLPHGLHPDFTQTSTYVADFTHTSRRLHTDFTTRVTQTSPKLHRRRSSSMNTFNISTPYTCVAKPRPDPHTRRDTEPYRPRHRGDNT